MSGVFDPAAVRANHDDLICRMAREHRGATQFNAFFWTNVVGDVALAHFVGASSDPAWNVPELLEMARSELRGRARVPAPSEHHDVIYNQHRAHVALALADWIATDELQPRTMGLAHDVYQLWLASYVGQKKRSLMSVQAAVELAIAAERFASGVELLDAHLPGKQQDPTKVRTPAELCLALSAGAQLTDSLARRYLRGQLARQLGGGRYLDAALSFYVAKVAGLTDPSVEALESAPQYISYLQTKKRPKKSLAELPVARVSPAAPETPRPARILASGSIRDDNPKGQWERTDAGWALFLRSSPDATAACEIDARAAEIIEWSMARGLAGFCLPPGGIGRLRALRRATLDGPALAEWARHDGELPLEVAFALPSTHAFADARRLSFPPKLQKSVWKDALDVGALTRLRALSLDGMESDKDRVRRGGGPYAAVPVWFAGSKLAAQLEALELMVSPHDLADSLRLFDVLPRLQELIFWIGGHNIITACFWCSRSDGMLIQARGIGVDDRLRGRGAWDALLQTVLTPAAATRLGKAHVTTVLDTHVDPATIRAAVGRYIDVGEVTVGGALREL